MGFYDNVRTRTRKIKDYLCGIELEVETQMWFQIWGAPLGTSRKESSMSRIWAPNPRFLENKSKSSKRRARRSNRNHICESSLNYVSQTWSQIATSWNSLKRLCKHFRSFRFWLSPAYPNDTPFRRKDCRGSIYAFGSRLQDCLD